MGASKSEVVREAKESLLVEGGSERTPVDLIKNLAEESLLSNLQKRTHLAAARQLRKDWSRGQRPS
jgi:hypothetical protein